MQQARLRAATAVLLVIMAAAAVAAVDRATVPIPVVAAKVDMPPAALLTASLRTEDSS